MTRSVTREQREAMQLDKTESIVRKQAVEFLHDDFHKRYVLDNIKAKLGPDHQALLKDVTQEDIDMLKSFFFNTVYPKIDERQQRDKSFESMVGMLKNPVRLGRIIPSMPALVLKYARIWPTALNVGISAMMTYLLSLRIETLFTKEILKIIEHENVKVDKSFKLYHSTYEEAYSRVPVSHGKRMIGAANRVMSAGKEPHLVETALNILHDVQNSLLRIDKLRKAAGRPPLYADPIAAMDFGKNVLEQVGTIFGSLGREKVTRIIKITKIMETDHLNTVSGRK